MTTAERLARAKRLRIEAEDIRRHGLRNFFAHTFVCAHCGWTGDEPERRCDFCPLRPFVPDDYGMEALPCQHITEQGWELAAEENELAERYSAWMLQRAAELEAEVPRVGK
jgi:ribosomal protein L37E